MLSQTVYDGVGNQVAQKQYEYDTTSLTGTTNAPQHDTNYSTGFLYRGNVSRVKLWRNTDGALLTTIYNYDDLGNVRSITDQHGNTSSYAYNDSWANGSCAPSGNGQAYVTQFTNALSQNVTFAYYPCSGLLQARKDQNDINASRSGTTYSYDLLGRILSKSLSDGGLTSETYKDTPPVSVTTQTKIDNANNLVSVAVKDGLGQVTQTQLTSDPDGIVYTDISYDAFGHTASQSNSYRSTGESTYGVTSFKYDVLGRRYLVTNPDNTTVTTSYVGLATEVSDEGNGTRSVKRVSQVDGLGRLVSVCEVSGTTLIGTTPSPAPCGQDISETGFLTSYQYDTLGNLTGVNQGGLNSRAFVYDSVSELTSATNPESGSTQFYYTDVSAALCSGRISDVCRRTDARGIITSYQYDQVNRIQAKSYTDGTPAVTFTYDASSVSGLASTLLNPVGRLVKAATNSTQTINSYDPMGRVNSQWQCTPQNCGSSYFALAYNYDLNGDLGTSTNGEGVTLTYSYDAAARLTSLTSSLVDANHPGNLLSSVHYKAFGSPSSANFGNGLMENRAYNSRTWLQTLTVQPQAPGAPVYTLTMGYEPNGDILSANDSANGNWTYGYDDFNRLLSANNGQAYSYDYDRFGNRWHQNGPNSMMLTFSGNNNRIDAASGYSYDAAGDVTGYQPPIGNTFSYAYDAESRLISVTNQSTGTTTCYVYDANGQRVRKTTNCNTQNASSVDYLYDLGGYEVTEVNSSGGWNRGEVYAGGRHLATYATSTTYFAHSDWLESERVRTNVSGSAYETCSNLPFGDILSCSGGNPSPMHFTGKERDAESGLDNFGARYNSSAMGRFMSPDPKILSIRHIINPQKWNKYAYTINNPLRYFDPNGMEEIEVQLRAFIQANTRSDPRGRTFAGDSRSFSSASNASSRTSITVRIETDASKRPGNPIISITPGSAGQTRQLDANGNVVNSAIATTGLPTVSGSRDANGNAVLNFKQDTVNPLEPQSLTPGIRANLTTTITQNGLSVDTTGTVSGSPSFELNVGSTNIALQNEPSSNAGFAAGLFVNLPIQNQTPLPPPPPPPPPCATDRERSCQ